MFVEIGTFSAGAADGSLDATGGSCVHRSRVRLVQLDESEPRRFLPVLFLLSVLSFLTLVVSFLRSDFSVALVVANSHSAKPLLYKVAGVWGNHEGSMMLWVLILNIFGMLVGLRGRGLPLALHSRVLGVQASISATFAAYILFSSNPFVRVEVPPFDGRDLNPLLQDPGLAFHPPFLYLGYVGFRYRSVSRLRPCWAGKPTLHGPDG